MNEVNILIALITLYIILIFIYLYDIYIKVNSYNKHKTINKCKETMIPDLLK